MTADFAIETTWSPAQAPVRFLELELTNRCQLSCMHCYALSAPTDGHGEMTLPDWKRLLDDAPAAGVSHVQLIGGEPTLHPDFALLLTHALAGGLKVEVFSNLLHITEPLWDLLARPGVELATSYYSDTPIQHDRITGRPGRHCGAVSHSERESSTSATGNASSRRAPSWSGWVSPVSGWIGCGVSAAPPSTGSPSRPYASCADAAAMAVRPSPAAVTSVYAFCRGSCRRLETCAPLRWPTS